MTVPLELEDEEPAAVSWETPEKLALTSATREALQSALEKLPVAYREVILLCHGDGDVAHRSRTQAAPPNARRETGRLGHVRETR